MTTTTKFIGVQHLVQSRPPACAASKRVEKQEVRRAPLPVYDRAKDGNPFVWIVRQAQWRRS